MQAEDEDKRHACQDPGGDIVGELCVVMSDDSHNVFPIRVDCAAGQPTVRLRQVTKIIIMKLGGSRYSNKESVQTFVRLTRKIPLDLEGKLSYLRSLKCYGCVSGSYPGRMYQCRRSLHT